MLHIFFWKNLVVSQKIITFAPKLITTRRMNKSFTSYYYFWFYFAGHCEAGSCV